MNLRSLWRGGAGTACIAVAFCVAPVHARDLPTSVGQLRSELALETRLGSKRTGVLCVPAGSVVWADAAPDPTRGAAAIVSALNAAGLSARLTEETIDLGGSWRRLTATIVAVRLDACVPQQGLLRALGGRKKLKAGGTVTVRWRIAEPGAANATVEWESVEPVAATTATQTLESVILSGLTRSAHSLTVAKGWPAKAEPTP